MRLLISMLALAVVGMGLAMLWRYDPTVVHPWHRRSRRKQRPVNAEVILAGLRSCGFAMLPPLSAAEVGVINSYFLAIPVYADAHVPQTARNRDDHKRHWRDRSHFACCCVHTDAAIYVPYLFERALELTDLVSEYLGVDIPVLYSANAFWTRSHGPSRPDIQEFHRDQDDARFVALFTMLTGTTERDGAQELEGPDGVVRSIHGSAGTTFLADTSRPHRGLKPTHGERGIHWFRWGVSERPPANQWDQIQPVGRDSLGDRYPVDHRLQRSIRLLVC